MYKPREQKEKAWTTFTTVVPKLGKSLTYSNTQNISIDFKNTNIFQQLTMLKTNKQTTEHDKSGTYKLTCNTCRSSNIGQTSRSLKLRFQEHKRYIKHNEPQST